jgi:hypothetical protein
MKATPKPRNREGFDRLRASLTDGKTHVTHKIDFLFAMNLEIALAYYHGGRIRAGWEMLREGLHLGIVGTYWSGVYRFCDKVGWTRLREIPGTPYFERHSGKCDKMNCSDMECVQRGIPKWFKKLTRMRDE